MSIVIENLLKKAMEERTGGVEHRHEELKRLDGIITSCTSILNGFINEQNIESEINRAKTSIENYWNNFGDRDYWLIGYEYALKQFAQYIEDVTEEI